MKTDRPASQAALARALGLSKSRVTALKDMGMPTHSIEAAERWRRANVRVQAKHITSRHHPEEPAFDGVGDDDVERELDMGDAFTNLAIAAHRAPQRHVYSLLHLLPMLTDAQYERARASGLISQRVWDAIGVAFDEVYER